MTVPEPKEPAPDQELIEAWCNGDELAATELVRRHAGALAGFLRGAGADPDDVDDVVQETFFRGFRRIETFRGGAAFRTWLMAIGSNALKDLWRKRQRRQVIPIDDRDFLDPRSDVSGEALARDLAGRLAEAVKVLPTLQRDVFLLRAQQGVAYDEIARVLGTTPGAARVHYHHAVKRLKKVLED